ncbi:MAG: hypothetical protein Q4E74_04880 [Ruminococcus sp.]|nr:hypothetical protein [Ruminococcus sp.]
MSLNIHETQLCVSESRDIRSNGIYNEMNLTFSVRKYGKIKKRR